MKRICFILIALSLLICSEKANSQNSFGAEITWTCAGQDSFLIKLIVYTDCGYIGQWNDQINFKCATTGAMITSLSVSPATPVDITPVCSASYSKCKNPASTFMYGINKYILQGLVKLNGAGNCCNIVMYWSSFLRSQSITTGAAGKPFRCEATLNRCLNPCDNSPTFTNSPILLLCKGQDFIFNHAALDSDVNPTGGLADSLTYHWAAPLQAAGTGIPYNGTLSYDKPITFYGFPTDTLALPRGLHLDHHTGDLKFRPMKNEVTVMVLQINEYRNGVKIGEIRRDLTIFVINCTANSPPVVSTQNNISTKHVCPGDTVTFGFVTSDHDANDYPAISWNNAIPGASWTLINQGSKHPSATLTWIVDKAHAGSLPYNFTVTAKDDACPLTAQFTQSYQVFVNPVPENITISDSGCGKYFFKSSKINGISPSYKWSSEDFSFSPDTGYLVSHIFSPGTYPLRLDLSLPACSKSYYDTVSVNKFMSVSLPADTTVCINSTITINAKVSNVTEPYTLQWGSGKITFPGNTSLSKQITITKDTSIWIRASYGNFNCPFDEIKIKVQANKISLPEDTFFCDLNHLVTPKFFVDQSVFSFFRWYKGVSPKVVGYNANLNVSDTGLFTLIATDTFGCSNTDMVRVHLNPEVIAFAPDQIICSGENVSIDADVIPNHTYSYKWWQNSKLLSTTGNLSVSPITTTLYTLVVSEMLHGVSCSASHNIIVYTKGNLTFEKFDIGCAGGKQIQLDSFVKVNGKRVADGSWTCPDEPSQIAANIFFTQSAYVNFNPGYKLYFSFFDNSTGCLLSSFVYLKVYPKPGEPQIIVKGDTVFCPGGSVSLTSSVNATHYKWSSGDTLKQVVINTSGKYNLSVANIYGCYSDLSKPVNVIVYPKVPKPGISLSIADSFLECNMKSGYYEWFYKPDAQSAYTKIPNNSGAINPKSYCKKCYFSVIYVDSNDCVSDTSAPYYFFVNSIDQNEQNSTLLIYPNPAHSQLFIENPTLKTYTFTLSNVLGNTLLQTTIIPGKNELSLTNYKPGIYFIFIDGVFAGKLLIE